MIRAATLLLAALATLPAGGGAFSARSTSIGETMAFQGDPHGALRGWMVSRSPDGRSTLTASFQEIGDEMRGTLRHVMRFKLSGKAGKTLFQRESGHLGEILWSPDSNRVALTLSGGGLGGVYDLFLLDSAGTHRISAPFRKALNPPRECDLRDFSNVGAVKWLSPTRLLVAAHQSHVDSCPQKNRAVFYIYDLPSRAIVQTLSRAEVRQRFPGATGYLLN